MSKNVSSASVVIGALRARHEVYNNAEYIMTNLNTFTPKMQFKSIFNDRSQMHAPVLLNLFNSLQA